MVNSRNKLFYSLFFLCLFLGLLLSVDFTNEGYASYLEQQDQEDLLALWGSLNDKQDGLKEELITMREQKSALIRDADSDSNSLANIQAQMMTLFEVNGVVAVKGPGVEVVFSGDKPLLYLDLVDLVNELWSSGAEAISVNNERVTATTSFFFRDTDSGIYLTANNHTLKYPIVIKAVGNPNILEKGLTFPGGIVDNLSTLYNIKPSIKKKEMLNLPAKKDSLMGFLPKWITDGILSGKN